MKIYTTAKYHHYFWNIWAYRSWASQICRAEAEYPWASFEVERQGINLINKIKRIIDTGYI